MSVLWPNTNRMSNRPRILHVGPLPPPIGGMQLNVQRFLRSKVAETFEITHIRTDIVGKLNFTGWRRFALNLLNCIVLIIQLVCKLISVRPAIVHIRTNSFAGFYEKSILSFIARLAGRKIIMHVHGGGFGDFYEQSTQFGKWLIRYCLGLNHRIVVLSAEMQKVFLDIGVEEEKLAIVENCVFMPDKSIIPRYAERTETQTNSSYPVKILFLNRIDLEKGIMEFIEAANIVHRQFPDVLFDLVGPRNALCEEIQKNVDKLDLSDSFTIRDGVMGDAKEQIFLASDIYVLPSYTEGMPIGLLEAMSYGLACVVTDTGGIPSVINNGENGILIPPRNSRALAEALERLIENEQLRRRLGENARETIRKRFNWENQALVITNLYNKLIKE